MKFSLPVNRFCIFFAVCLVAFAGNLHAQSPVPLEEEESFAWWYIALFLLSAALAVAVGLWFKKRKETPVAHDRKKVAANDDSLTFDADKEYEWLRKNQ